MMFRRRFRAGKHALDTLETFLNRFGNFYFSSKNHNFWNFQKILKILENPWFWSSEGLSRVAIRQSMERGERSPGGGRIGARGRRRRPRTQKHARNHPSIVPTDLYGEWRSLTRFFENPPNLSHIVHNPMVLYSSHISFPI